jgi:hypothetical protein
MALELAQTNNMLQKYLTLLLHFMICHSKNVIDPAPQDVIKTTRWNNIRDAIGMHKM